MNEKPLDEKDFEACKMIVNAKHADDQQLYPFAKWTYSEYLISRWKMKKRDEAGGLMLICSVNFNHKVISVTDECVVETDADDGKVEATDCYGDEVYHCKHNDKDLVMDDTMLDEFEALCRYASQS
jgi:hypothetical protein